MNGSHTERGDIQSHSRLDFHCFSIASVDSYSCWISLCFELRSGMSDYWVLPTLQQQAVPVASGSTTSTKKSTISKRYGCCMKECLLQLPPELVKQTKDYFARFSSGIKTCSCLAKSPRRWTWIIRKPANRKRYEFSVSFFRSVT